MKTSTRSQSRGLPVITLILSLPLFALAAWAGVALALWQVPPNSLEPPLPLPIGSTVPVVEARPVAVSQDPATLRDYHFTRAVGGEWQSYLNARQVELVNAPAQMRVLGFDADLARIRLIDTADSPAREAWVSEAQLLHASRHQHGYAAGSEG